MKIEKTCYTCGEQLVCEVYGKAKNEEDKYCKHWTISLDAYQEYLRKNKITNPNEMEKALKQLLK